MDASPARERYHLFEGDCNFEIASIVAQIPERSLALAFLDPTGLHVHLTTVKALADRGRTDLLILFPDAVDVLRNEEIYMTNLESNLDLVLGDDSNWRTRKAELGSTDGAKRRRLYADIYKEQLRNKCGYLYFDHEVISGKSGPLYRLVYATKSERGLDFWQKSVKVDSAGQSRFNLES